MRITHLLVLGLLVATLPVQFDIADTDGERTALAQIIHELQSIEPLIRRAESQIYPDSRIHFRYDWLRQDLSRVRDGIQARIEAPVLNPEPFHHCVAIAAGNG